MDIVIQPQNIQGTIEVPSSKSVSQRAIAAAYISKQKCILKNIGTSKDELAALAIIASLGAHVEQLENGDYLIHNEGNIPQAKVYCGESGLSARMFTPIAATLPHPIEIHGEGSLLKRPFNDFDEMLPNLEVEYKSQNGYLPLNLKGPLVHKNIEIDGQLSSQFLTGLIMAYVAANADGVSITCRDLNSKPYIDLTLQVLEDFGLPIPQHENYEEFVFTHKQQKVSSSFQYTVEGDWSSAAILMVMGATAGKVELKNLNLFSKQADTKILEVLQDCGCRMSINMESTTVSKPAVLSPFIFDATDCPDLFPPLVILAAQAHGTSAIKGIHRLWSKESNRVESLEHVLTQLQVDYEVKDDHFIIRGGRPLVGNVTIDSHNDHRIAMVAAVAAMQASGPVTITGAECVAKSFPDFFKVIAHLEKVSNL